jgi:6-phosphogluconolactonase/glucosamine-6-phosphate isomerase/deaminase
MKLLQRFRHYVALFSLPDNFYKDFAATQHFSQQRSCEIFVDEYITKFLKQRSCEILIGSYFTRTIMIKNKESEIIH